MRLRQHVSFRLIALVLLTALLAQDIAFANPSPGIFQQAISRSFDQGAENIAVQGKRFELQTATGKITQTFQGKSKVPVFLVQDAHYHLQAQENAAITIAELIKKFNIRVIGVEGASGELWHDWATRYPNESARKKVFQFWLNRHEIGAAEYAVSQAPHPIRVFGLENADLYERHLQVDRLVRTRRVEIQQSFIVWRGIFKSLLSQAMPAAYLAHTATIQTGSDSIVKDINPLLAAAKKLGINLSRYPQMNSYAELEKGMEKINDVILMREFRRIQDMDLRVGFLRLAVKPNVILNQELQSKIDRRKLSKSMPHLVTWLKQVNLASKLNEKIVTEFKDLDAEIRKLFLVTDEQVWLDELSRWTDLLEKWKNLEWAPEDAALYERDSERFLNPETISKVMKLAARHHVEMGREWESLFESATWAPWFEFYVQALKRDSALAENTEKIMHTSGNQPILIYAGGFHTPGLERDLRKHSISFITIRPVIHRDQNSSEKLAYEKALDGSRGLFQKILKQSLNVAGRGKRIPFELVPPRQFPTVNRPEASSQVAAAFLPVGSALLAAADVINPLAVKPSFSFMTQASQSWWEKINLNTERHGVTGQTTAETPGGKFLVRWKINGAVSNSLGKVGDAAVWVSGNLNHAFLTLPTQKKTTVKEAAKPVGSFGNLLPKGLKPRAISETPLRDETKTKELSRSELRKPNLIIRKDSASVATPEALSLAAKNQSDEKIPQVRWLFPVICELASFGIGLYLGWSWIQIALGFFSIRMGWVLTLLKNEWGHIAASSFVGKFNPSVKNVFGGHNLFVLLGSVLPLFPLVLGGVTTFNTNTQSQIGTIRKWGWGIGLGMSAAFSAALLSYLPVSFGVAATFILPPFFIAGAVLALVAALWTDILNPPKDCQSAFCGNVSYGRNNGNGEVIDEEDEDLINRMIEITMLRGGQAGGGNVMVQDNQGKMKSYRDRIVAGRRTFLPQVLAGRRRENLSGKKAGAVSISQNHLRFGTASDPSVSETHPHQFSPEQEETEWYFDGTSWKTREINWSNTVTHNGDFDNLIKPNGHIVQHTFGFKGKMYTYEQMRVIGQYFLGVKNTTKGDSPAIVAPIDMMHVRGQWKKSFLYAYMHGIDDFESSFQDGKIPTKIRYKNGAPVYKNYKGLTPVEREAMTVAWELEWAELLRNHAQSAEAQIKVALTRFFEKNRSAAWAKKLPPTHREEFIANAVKGFLHQDLYAAVKEFMLHADGSFGLVFTSTVTPDRSVFASLYQPLSLGLSYDKETNKTRFAVVSESHALKAKTKNGRGFDERLDLDMTNGEIFEVALPDWGRPRLRGFSIAQKRELTERDVIESGRYFAPGKSPYMSELPERQDEKVWAANDFKEMALHYRLIDESHDAKKDANSLQIQTQRAFAGFLLEKDLGKKAAKSLVRSGVGDISTAAEEEYVRLSVEGLVRRIGRIESIPKEIDKIVAGVKQLREQSAGQPQGAAHKVRDAEDIIIYAEENSFQAALAIAASLREATGLRVTALPANYVLKAMKEVMPEMNEDGKYSIREFVINDAAGKPIRISRTTVALGISHSGETFATTLVTAALRKVLGNRVFIQTGEIDSRMAVSIGQGLGEEAPWIGRIITSFPDKRFASLRPSEAASLVPLLQQHTLSRFLLGVMERVNEKVPSAQVLDLKWSRDQIERMNTELDLLAQKKIPEITGYNSRGKPIDSQLNMRIKKQYRKWEKHLAEGAIVWLMGAVYILLTVPVRLLYFPQLEVLLPGYYFPAVMGPWVTGLLYIFLGAFMTYTLRIVQRREIFRRLSLPAILNIDPYSFVYGVVGQYAIKLFSLAPGIFDPAIYRGDAIQDVGHTYAAQARRGTLMHEGLPDERKLDGVSDYESGRLSGSQTKGVKSYLFGFLRYFGFKPTGTEVIAITHSSAERPNAATHELHLDSDRNADLSVADNFSDFLIERLKFNSGGGFLPENTKFILTTQDAAENSDLAKLRLTIKRLFIAEGRQKHHLQEELVKALGGILNVKGKDLVPVDRVVREFIDHQLHFLQFHSRHVDSPRRAATMMQGLYYAVERIARLPIMGWPLGQTQNRTKIATTATSVSAVGVQAVLDKIPELDPSRKKTPYEGTVSFEWGRLNRDTEKTHTGEVFASYEEPEVMPKAWTSDQMDESRRRLLKTTLDLGERYLREANHVAIQRWLQKNEAKFNPQTGVALLVEQFLDLQDRMLGFLETEQQPQVLIRMEGDSTRRSELRNLVPALQQAAAFQGDMMKQAETERLRNLLMEAAQLDRKSLGVSNFSNTLGWVVLENPSDADLIRTISLTGKKILIHFDDGINPNLIARMREQLKGTQISGWIIGTSLASLQQKHGWKNDEILRVRTNQAVESLSPFQRNGLIASLLGSEQQSVVIYGQGRSHLQGVREETIMDMFERLMVAQQMISRSV